MPWQRANGRWQAATMIDGKRIRADFDTEAQASAQEARWKAEAKVRKRIKIAGKGVTPGEATSGAEGVPKGVTMGELIRECQRVKWSQVRSKSSHRSALGRIERFLGANTPVAAIDSAVILAFMEARRAEGVKGGTWNRDAAALSVLFRYAVDAGYTATPPRLPRLREDPPRERLVHPDELRRILDYFMLSGDRDAHDVVLILAHTGVRNSELWRLRWRDVDEVAGTMYVKPGKTDRGRTLPLSPEALALLKDRRANEVITRYGRPVLKGPDDRVFPWWGNSRLSRAWTKAKIGVGLDYDDTLVPYCLRHTVGSLLAGENAFVAQKWLGHANIQTSQRYVHLQQGALASSAGSIMRHFGGNGGNASASIDKS